MGRQRILLANELCSYRQTMTIALRGLRSAAEVTAVEPESLDEEVERRHPHVVLCSRTTPAVRRFVPVWVGLYKELDVSVSHVSVHGVRSKVVGGMDLDDVLAIIDGSPASPGPATGWTSPPIFSRGVRPTAIDRLLDPTERILPNASEASRCHTGVGYGHAI